MEGNQPHLSSDATTPDLRKAPTPAGREDADTAVIAVVIALVFLTLLTVLAAIATYLYRNQGSYRTYEQPEPGAAPRDEAPSKEKEEYFI